MRAVAFGAGDTHRGGLTVSRVDFAGGSVMYKPRPSESDVALGALLDELYTDFPGAPSPDERIRVPRTQAREGYGWAEFVHHRYCAGEAELAAFYRNVGHWLAVLRFTGGTDMHAENMIAAGPVPVIVDAETLFDAPRPSRPAAEATRWTWPRRPSAVRCCVPDCCPYAAPASRSAGSTSPSRVAARPAAADPEPGDRGRRHRGGPLPG